MKLAFDIARRYLFGQKSVNAINIITGVSVVGISVGAAALILILSVFNGFEDLLGGYLNAFNPDLKVTPAKGKFFEADSAFLDKIKSVKGVESYSLIVEEVASLQYDDASTVGVIKGVDDNYNVVNNIDTTLVIGDYLLENKDINYAILGIGLANKLGVNVSDQFTPLSIYMLKNKKKSAFEKFFKTVKVMPSGKFEIRSEADMEYVIIPIRLAHYLIDDDKKYSAIEIRTTGEIEETKTELQNVIGDKFEIKDRFEQDEALMKLMKIEKWVSYAIISLSLFLVAINLIGSLWMIVLDKRRDISILKSMGATKKMIKRIFIYLGLLISFIGLILGFILALGFYFAQKNFGIISLGQDSSILSEYPIELRFFDFVIVTITVLLIGYILSRPPANKAGKISAYMRDE